jgi:hypothetical protein
MSCSPSKAAPLTSTSPSPTQRSFTVAVVVTIVCLPLLLLDLMWSGGSGARSVSEASAEVTIAPAVDAAAIPGEPVTTAPPADPVTVVAAPSTTAALKAPAPVAPAIPAKRSAAPVTTKPPVWTPPPTTVAPAPPPPIVSSSDAAFLACVRSRESGGNYAIVDSSGQYMGAYQFSQSTWDGIASRSGRSALVGVHPNNASPADQDAIAFATLAISGRSPWGGLCS